MRNGTNHSSGHFLEQTDHLLRYSIFSRSYWLERNGALHLDHLQDIFVFNRFVERTLTSSIFHNAYANLMTNKSAALPGLEKTVPFDMVNFQNLKPNGFLGRFPISQTFWFEILKIFHVKWKLLFCWSKRSCRCCATWVM